jgi:hypothetical protein
MAKWPRKKLCKPKTEFQIAKRTAGTQFPWEYWEGPFPSEKAALRVLKRDYHTGSGELDDTFAIVKITYEDIA